jgi:hypothetical protein
MIIRRNGIPRLPFSTARPLPYDVVSGNVLGPDAIQMLVGFTLKDGSSWNYLYFTTTLQYANVIIRNISNLGATLVPPYWGGCMFNWIMPATIVDKQPA